MRRIILIVWLLLLPVGGAYHLLAGPQHQKMDLLGRTLSEARRMATAEQWDAAVPLFEEALAGMPAEMSKHSRAVRLEMAQAKMNAAKLPEAHGEIKSLLEEVLEQENSDPAFESQVRESLANSQFYMTWLMRLEGMAATEWEPEIESARQNYRLLAENAEQSGDANAAKKQRMNLEASIRLARLDLGDLQGLPLPNQ